MLRSPIHNDGSDPLGAASVEDLHPQIQPPDHELAHREQAEHVRGRLTEELETLKLLEHEMRGTHDPDLHERLDIDKVSAAVHYLLQAVDVLSMDGQE